MNDKAVDDIGCSTEFGLLCKLVIDELPQCNNLFELALQIHHHELKIAKLGSSYYSELLIDVDKPETFPIRVSMHRIEGGCSIGMYYRMPMNQLRSSSTLADFYIDSKGIATSKYVRQKTIDDIFKTLEAWQRLDAIQQIKVDNEQREEPEQRDVLEEISSPNDERDKWLREQKEHSPLTLSQILVKMEREHPEWEQIDHPSSMNQAIKRYEDRKGLTRLPNHKKGRTKSN